MKEVLNLYDGLYTPRQDFNNTSLYLRLYNYYIYILQSNCVNERNKKVESLIEELLKHHDLLDDDAKEYLISLIINYAKLVKEENKYSQLLKDSSIVPLEDSLNKLELDLIYAESLIEDKKIKEALEVYNKIFTSLAVLKKSGKYNKKASEFYSFFFYKYARTYSYVDDVKALSIVEGLVKKKLKEMQQNINVYTIKEFLKAYFLYDEVTYGNHIFGEEFSVLFINRFIEMLQGGDDKSKYTYEYHHLNVILLHMYILYDLKVKYTITTNIDNYYKSLPIKNIDSILNNLEKYISNYLAHISEHQDKSKRHNYLYIKVINILKTYYTIHSFDIVRSLNFYGRELFELSSSDLMLKTSLVFKAYEFCLKYIRPNCDSYLEKISNEAFKMLESLLDNEKELYIALNNTVFNLLYDVYYKLTNSFYFNLEIYYDYTILLFRYTEKFYLKRLDPLLVLRMLSIKGLYDDVTRSRRLNIKKHNEVINYVNSNQIINYLKEVHDPFYLVELAKDEKDKNNLYLYAMYLVAIASQYKETQREKATKYYLAINDIFNKFFELSVFEPFIIVDYFMNIKDLMWVGSSEDFKLDVFFNIVENMLTLEELSSSIGFNNINYTIIYDALLIIKKAFYKKKHHKRLKPIIDKYLKLKDRLLINEGLSYLNDFKLLYKIIKMDYLIGVFYILNKDYHKAEKFFYMASEAKIDEIDVTGKHLVKDLDKATMGYFSRTMKIRKYSVNAIMMLVKKRKIIYPNDEFLSWTKHYQESKVIDPLLVSWLKRLLS